MKHINHKCLLASMLLVITGIGPITRANARQPLAVTLEFEYLRQGRTGVIRLNGAGIIGGAASTMGRVCPFFPVSQGFACLLAVPMEQRIKDYPLTITATKDDGSTFKWEGTLKVTSGQFIAEPDFNIPSDKFYLLRQDLQANEDKRLETIYSRVTPRQYWEGTFAAPVDGPLTSPFGSVRSYNDGSVRRHTGYDLRAATGVPVLASSSGRVVLARSLDIHGNIVVIDHGWGVFSSYSHLSEMFVVPGQFVLQGEIIGRSGNTGRSLGPHVHWEIAVDGIVTDPSAFSRLKLPN